ncbi:GNAT family N-acetyltransferase [Blastococcus sp. MG754426]|uniref:GNAT family N-acetyltransferase n=1 Tax=unclassified Blastococcus TaxID=2619396 RepID=UPI001EF0FFF6|nr:MULTISPECIES: GNAT family N-acetyltransferase [unclassified Blastococcus]MCF6505816.1 GNAT family N-acetyltransferase [Blastococcus sp. MG754426]MCF6511104.1 GNAT family N-acetyltransferase [Blastococcus sp. MG754427]MCF6734973.1 GNAT family N-acetyltransferase [Blastococcus sp. KM273129]
MTDGVLLHLVEPPAWRAALRAGSIAPAAEGFVHLSAPGQVHLPAQRLFPGRRDLVLLVVDPARLPDAVRWEPGHPDDPAGSLFPHLHGPLPTSSVVAVIPYRPPAPVEPPTPEDALGRAVALYTSVPVRRAVGVGDVPGGVAVLDPDHPHSRDNNRLVLTRPVTAAAVEAAAEEVGGNAGWPHLAALLTWPGAGSVAAELAGRGWNAEELVLMGRPADLPVPGTAVRAEVVDQREVHDLWDRGWRRDLAGLGDRLEPVVRQLIGREQLNDRVLAVTDVVVREDGRVVAAAQLRVDGATAAVESVMTDPRARGRGYGDAVLARVLELAAAAGCDLVVLEAAGDDWPRHWYARRGFTGLGSTWAVDRPV